MQRLKYAEQKLDAVFYHFHRMKEARSDSEFGYELNAFLSTARSIPDVLLEDFNEKYSLGILLEEMLTHQKFEEKAKLLGNDNALDFLNWWSKKIGGLRANKIGSLLFKKRNISIHRRPIKPDVAKLTVTETIHSTASISIQKYDAEGKLIEEARSQEEHRPKPAKEERKVETNWFFSEYPEENVIAVCQKIYSVMKELIENAKVRFND